MASRRHTHLLGNSINAIDGQYGSVRALIMGTQHAYRGEVLEPRVILVNDIELTLDEAEEIGKGNLGAGRRGHGRSRTRQPVGGRCDRAAGMSSPFDPRDTEALAVRGFDVIETAKRLNGIAKVKGYGVTGSTTGDVADLRVRAESLGEEPTSWYRVYPLDQPDEARGFETADEVRAHLETLPDRRIERG